MPIILRSKDSQTWGGRVLPASPASPVLILSLECVKEFQRQDLFSDFPASPVLPTPPPWTPGACALTPPPFSKKAELREELHTLLFPLQAPVPATQGEVLTSGWSRPRRTSLK